MNSDNNEIIQLDAEELKKEFPKHVYIIVRAEELKSKIKELKNEIRDFIKILNNEVDKTSALIETLESELENWQEILKLLEKF